MYFIIISKSLHNGRKITITNREINETFESISLNEISNRTSIKQFEDIKILLDQVINNRYSISYTKRKNQDI